MGKKTERVEFRLEESTYKFIDNLRKSMEEERKEHIPISEVLRKIITTFELLNTSPNADLTEITMHAAEFQQYIEEEG
jgi:hypothetical protein